MDFHNPAENSLLELLLNGKRYLFITGEVDSGKTSTVERIISLLKKNGRSVGGFYSKGIFDQNKKIGFNIADINSGELTQIASATADRKFLLKQGKFFFNPEVFSTCNERNTELPQPEVFIVDEIGYLELKNDGFFPLIKNLVNHFKGKLVLSIRKSVLTEMINKLKLNESEIDLVDLSRNNHPLNFFT